ncbi:hypothetical protein ACLOJK_010461 [Asimina triloba]
MTSGPLIGGGGTGGSLGDNHRWAESKVYTRKSNKGLRPNTDQQSPRSVSLQTLTPTEDANSSHHQPLLSAASDDSSSRHVITSNGLDSTRRITISVSSCSRHEVRDLRRRLGRELDQVRSHVRKLEAREDHLLTGYAHSQLSASNAVNQVHSEVASAGPRQPHQLSASVFSSSQGGGGGASSDVVDNEKRRPKTNLQHRNSEILVSKKPKSNAGKKQQVNVEAALKECAALLSKLMKHSYGWVFNKPVDVKGLGLHDYFSIIKHPMDLGTIKSRLSKNRYKSPRAFAEDVRLTFRNAMTYNPDGQDVHVMAKEVLKVFEDRWAVLESEYNLKPRKNFDDEGKGERYPGPRRFDAEEDVRHSLVPSRRLGKEDAGHSAAAARRFDGEEAGRSAVPARRFDKEEMGHSTATPHKVRKSPPPELKRTVDRSESTTLPANARPAVSVSFTPTGRVAVPKKPKAKDPNKRDMTYEEKQRLSTNLINLPPEKLENIVQIIKKRNSELSQHDDEIEVDIDSFDVETLWELDRFITNYKKSLSKNKKKNELATQPREENAHNNVQEVDPVPSEVELPKESSKGCTYTVLKIGNEWKEGELWRNSNDMQSKVIGSAEEM